MENLYNINILTCFTLIHQLLTFCPGNILKIVLIMIFILCMLKYFLQRIRVLVYMTSTIIKYNKANIYSVVSSNWPYWNFLVSKMSYRLTFFSVRSNEIRHIFHCWASSMILFIFHDIDYSGENLYHLSHEMSYILDLSMAPWLDYNIFLGKQTI